MVSGGNATLQAKEEFIRADGTVDVPATLGDFPFPFGQYFFLASALNLNASTRCDYEWRVTVVPEPGAGAGACVALLAVGALARHSAKRGNYGN